MQVCQIRKRRPPWTTYLFLLDGDSTTKVTIVASQPKPHFHDPHQEKIKLGILWTRPCTFIIQTFLFVFVASLIMIANIIKWQSFSQDLRNKLPNDIVGRRTWGMFPSSVHKKKRLCKSFEMGITTKRHIHEHFMDKSLA